MENLKFFIFSILILALLGFAGYWAFSTIESGSTHVSSQEQKELKNKNEELEKQVADLQRQISLLQLENEEQTQQEQEILDSKIPEPTITTTTTTPTKVAVSKYQTLINDLQKLINGNIYLKLKSQGPAVGTIQKSLNAYNNTSNKIDNDYGSSTVTAVKNFQKAEGLTVDGETGPNTYKKMISWLKNH
jgi:murein L,D-transpeptidase YcbB/YkuD